MKQHTLFVLGLWLASTANAADIVPTQFKAFESDLARPELKLKDAYSYRLGLNFVEGHKYVLHPINSNLEDASSIRRELNLSLRLPFRIETGIALYDSQQATSDQLTAIYGDVKHKSQHLGGALWARYHLLEQSHLNASILLQYEAGSADRASFHQASQDKTGVAMHLDGSPFAYTQVGAFLGATRRKDESFRGSRLNDELLYGTRISVGPSMVQLFGEVQSRVLPWKTAEGAKEMPESRLYEVGLSGSFRNLNLQASTFIPTTKRFVGVPERGIHIAFQWMIGKSPVIREPSPAQAPSPNGRPALNPEDEGVPTAAPAVDSSDAFKSDVKELGLGEIPIFQDEPRSSEADMKATETLTLPGTDEFQKFETAQEAERQRPESATERAEREYKAQLDNQQKIDAAKAKQAETSEASDRIQLLKQIEAEERELKSSAADIEKELNQYTLPDSDDIGWDGLSQ